VTQPLRGTAPMVVSSSRHPPRTSPNAWAESSTEVTAEIRNGHKSWWHDHTATALPPWFGLYVSLEDSAETIRKYESELIPGLLQIPAYAREVTSAMAGYLTEEEIDRRVTVRMERQSLLSRPRAPHLNVILGEAILHRPVGGPALMSEQLRHLLEITHQPNVRLRVVPYAAGVHGGMAVGGGFSMLDFPVDRISGQPLEPPLVYVESLTGAMYLTKPVEVSAYALAWDSLEAKAFDEDTSRETIITVLDGLPHA
jgi:hypothetical protein